MTISQSSPKKTLVFIDSGVSNYPSLLGKSEADTAINTLTDREYSINPVSPAAPPPPEPTLALAFAIDSVTADHTASQAQALAAPLAAAPAYANAALIFASFTPEVSYATGNRPYSVTSLDANGDGKMDLAVANLSSSTVSVLLGKGDGTFVAKVDYATGLYPRSVTSLDANADGKMDLAVANGSGVSVLLGKGDGTFATKVDYAAGSSVTSLDANADGKMDLVVANGSGVSVLLGKGDGTFATKVDYATGSGPYSLTSFDANADGKMDLVVANGSGVSVLLNNGNGTFAPKVDYATGSGPYSVTSLDANADGKMDLAVANYYSNTISVLLGKGDGTFATKVDYATGSDPYSVTSLDANADGKMDLVVANAGSNTISVLQGNGDGTFAAKFDYATGSYPSSVTALDANGDGKMDLAVANGSSGTVSVLLNITSAPAPTVPTMALSSPAVSISEGNTASQPLTFTVNLSAASSTAVTVNYATANGTATAGSDYTATSGVLTFAAGETSKTVAVLVLGDTLVESNETFTLNLSSPSGATLGSVSSTTATIINDDSTTSTQSKLNDFVVLQYASSSIVGADAGNDTYLISGSMVSAGQAITISDAKGSNSIQLASGLSIASSQVTSNALKLTLSNGGTVTVLNANLFTYDVGGNTSAGIDNVDVGYASFVQNTLGVTLPSSGVVSGGVKVMGAGAAQTAIAVASKLNDFVVLQYASSSIVGADAGNDTYLISGSMVSAGQAITISDAKGSNSIQLASGLSIASSQVTSNALKLTLSNGGTVTVLNADLFTYDVGGNTSAGIDNIDVGYASFVQNTLGVTLPSSGVVSGGVKVIGAGSATSLVAGSSTAVTATNQADTFSFAPAGARALTANTQITINQFDTAKDKFQFDLTSALGLTTLAALNGVEGITVQSNPFVGAIVINFGADANGDLVALTLTGVTTPDSVIVEVI